MNVSNTTDNMDRPRSEHLGGRGVPWLSLTTFRFKGQIIKLNGYWGGGIMAGA
jgi:hypothetical protein